MMRIELQVEHSYKNRFVGRHRIFAGGRLTTLGSSREADIRLLGDNVSGVHATLEWSDDKWLLSDLGSEHGTWIQKKPVIQQTISETTIIQIGNHQIKLTPVVMKHDLFHRDQTEPLDKAGDLFHQVVVRKNGLLVENALVPMDQPYEIFIHNEKLSLLVPTSEQWVVSTKDNIEIRQRLVKTDVIKQTSKDHVQQILDPRMRGPLTVAGLALITFLVLMFFLPQAPRDEMLALAPESQNVYTRMIFDAKKIKKKKAESQQLSKQIAAQLPDKQETNKAAPKAASATGVRVVNKLKASNLRALIGKISARAAKNTTYIQSAGMAPNVQGTGTALSSGRSVASTSGRSGFATDNTQKIAGVATGGKGGGSADYKGTGGLAVGSVGSASVGVLEDETEVEGGLDKDVIARYIKTQLGQIRYCYERQLSASPDLYGKVLVKFTIGTTGAVTTQTIGATSLNNAMVEGCILRRVAGWQFPTPAGGTQVIVSYPFLFKSTR